MRGVDSVSDFGKRIRLRRFFKSASHKVLAVAFDHGLVLGPITGTVGPAGHAEKIAVSGVDAILLNLELLPRCVKALTQSHSPSLIIRLDCSSAWTATANGGSLRSELLAQPEDALRNGADAVPMYLFVDAGRHGLSRRVSWREMLKSRASVSESR